MLSSPLPLFPLTPRGVYVLLLSALDLPNEACSTLKLDRFVDTMARRDTEWCCRHLRTSVEIMVEIQQGQIKVVRYISVSEMNVCECGVGAVKRPEIEAFGAVNGDKIGDREAQ